MELSHQTSQKPSLKASLSFPLSFLFLSILNVDMMAGAPAIVLDHEDKGHIMGQ